ncbi:ABC transporter permease [Pseudonocardia sp. CA-107938]|uniref:ABC transporter permease n=1 Tax=Pseudonocardia sp. CA-107938 TaxID=3240021 RepID=UPI003D94D723
MNPRIVVATAGRVLTQLRADRRTVALLLVVPGALLALTHEMIDSRPSFDRLALALLGVFPFTTMFLVTSVAMLRERTSGTLERLLTTPLAKLDLLLGYGIAFALAATVQAGVTCAVAYGPLGLQTPGSAGIVAGVAVLDAVMGTAVGLLASAFATSEFQAVQFMPAVVMPQVLLGGLFVPREQMADWLQHLSDALPLTYAIDALHEVGSTSLVTSTLLRDVAVVLVTTLVALGLAAATLHRRQGPLPQRARRVLVAVPAVLALAATSAGVVAIVGSRDWVVSDDARIDGVALPIRAPASGTLVEWSLSSGTTVRADQPVGRIEMDTGFARARAVVRAPAAGTVVTTDVSSGTWVTAGTRLAVATDLSRVRVVAHIDAGLATRLRPGQPATITVDAYPATALDGTVAEIRDSTATATEPLPAATSTGAFERPAQDVPVHLTITDPRGLALLPGMTAHVRIHTG